MKSIKLGLDCDILRDKIYFYPELVDIFSMKVIIWENCIHSFIINQSPFEKMMLTYEQWATSGGVTELMVIFINNNYEQNAPIELLIIVNCTTDCNTW